MFDFLKFGTSDVEIPQSFWIEDDALTSAEVFSLEHLQSRAAELAATLDHMAAFAHLAQVVPAHLFDLYHDATLGRDDLRAFMLRDNPAALAAMEDLFQRLRDAGLWLTRSNSIAAKLEARA